jgi:glycosyltransferase involved in cell wall biosynthesis
MVKVLYVIDQKPDGYPGGIEYHQLDLISSFIRKKIPVYLLFPERDFICLRLYENYRIKEFKYPGRRLDDHRLRDADIENTFQQILNETHVDIVHFQSIRTLPLSLVEIAKNNKKKVLLTLHEYYFWCINCIMLAPDFCWFEEDEETCYRCLVKSKYKISEGYVKERRQYINSLFQIVDKVITPSFYVKDVFLSLYKNLVNERCAVIEFGIDKNILESNGGKSTRVKNGKLYLAFLGNFLHYKGNRTFLELLKYYKNSDALDFTIIGNIYDPSLVPSHKNLTVAGGYTRDKVVKKIQHINPDLILLLSNWPETFSYTLSEAIASSMPVIATDCGALRERVAKEAVGFLVPVEDPVPRIIEIIEDLKHHPEIMQFLRKKVLEAQKRLRTVDSMIEDIFTLYNSLE